MHTCIDTHTHIYIYIFAHTHTHRTGGETIHFSTVFAVRWSVPWGNHARKKVPGTPCCVPAFGDVSEARDTVNGRCVQSMDWFKGAFCRKVLNGKELGFP